MLAPVSDFEFLFGLFGLMLGLSLAEVLAGLARSIEQRLQPRSTLRIGWLTPMLAVFVLLDLLSFWGAAWLTRGLVRVSGESLFFISAFAGAYYMAARLVFPRDFDELSDLDQHFFRLRRIVIGILLVLLVVQIGWFATIPDILPRLLRPLSLGLTILLALLMILAMTVRTERMARIVLALLIARYVLGYLLL